MKRLIATAAIGLAGLIGVAACGSATDSQPAAQPVATNPSGWTTQQTALIPKYFPPDQWDDACVTGKIQGTYRNADEYLADLHTIGARAMVFKTGVLACSVGR